jgi:CheY-like chemotaxis protein
MDKIRGTILVIDDDVDIQDAVGEILVDEGYTVCRASNGREAIKCLREHDLPELILLDLMMPVMNGWQFREEQSRDPELSRIPVVVLSAGVDADEQATALHAAGFLSKPVGLDSLLSMVGRYCSPQLDERRGSCRLRVAPHR